MKGFFAFIVLVIAFGLVAGPGDFENEKIIEAEVCKQMPKPSWCE